MTIKGLLQEYYKTEIELLLAHILKKPKEFVFLHPDKSLSADQLISLSALVKRRMKGEPIAYLLGYKDFYGNQFKVNRDVLIPRPETEMVVDLVMRNLLPERSRRPNSAILPLRQAQGSKLRILDIGTGSGCIIISLAKALQAKGIFAQRKDSLCCEFYASDVSTKALNIAKQNAKTILRQYFHTTQYESIVTRPKIKFLRSDLLAKIKINPDIIIANLPYGWNEWKNNSSAETIGLKFEPKQALFAKEHGLYHIRRLLQQITVRKQKPKLIYLEFDPRQKQELAKLTKKYLPGGDIKFHKDFNGLWRYLEIGLH